MRNWSALFFISYLTLQVALPTYRLFQPRPSRFGWQMFSASALPSRVWLVTNNDAREVSPAKFIGNYRADLEWERYAPLHLCRQSPIQSVRYLMPAETAPREFKC